MILHKSEKYHSEQLKLFKVKTRLENLIESFDENKDQTVWVDLPKLPKLVRKYAPQHFKS